MILSSLLKLVHALARSHCPPSHTLMCIPAKSARGSGQTCRASCAADLCFLTDDWALFVNPPRRSLCLKELPTIHSVPTSERGPLGEEVVKALRRVNTQSCGFDQTFMSRELLSNSSYGDSETHCDSRHVCWSRGRRLRVAVTARSLSELANTSSANIYVLFILTALCACCAVYIHFCASELNGT